MEDIDAQEGETPRFAVVVEGKPVPDIMWYKVGWDPATAFLTHRPPDPHPPLPHLGHRVGALVLCSPPVMQNVPCAPSMVKGCRELVGDGMGPP